MRPGEVGFVGRETDLAAARDVIDAAAGGRGGLLLVTGEAGMGKTRLAEEAAVHAQARGVGVRWGTAWEGGGAPPFWPWVQVLRDLPGAREHAELAALFGEQAAGGESAMAAEGARFRMFDAVATRLAEAGPQLIVLDDLHWADPGSLHLLAFLPPRLRGSRIAILGTARDEELAPGLAEPMGALARHADRIELQGLDNAAVDRLLAEATGHEPGASVSAAIRQRTAGNPFFVRELARLGDPQWQTWVPDSVGDVVRRRVDRLDPAVAAALEMAAVLGQEFALDLLSAVSGMSGADVLDAMDAAAAAGLVRDAGPQRRRFVHALARDALYEALPTRRRLELHRAAGDELARSNGSAGEIALHLSRANDPRAGDFALRAGRHALERLAPEQAADHLRLAADQLTDEWQRLDALIALAVACDRSGRLDDCRAAAAEAADLAHGLGDARREAQAAIAYKRAPTAMASGLPDPVGTRLVERALPSLGDEDSRERAMLILYLARDIYLFDSERARGLMVESHRIARAAGDALAVGWSGVHIAQTIYGHEQLENLIAVAAEARASLVQAGDPEYQVVGTTALATLLMQAGRPDEVWALAGEIERRSDELGVGSLRYYARFIRGMRALMEGRLDEAERLAREAYRSARRAMGEAATAHGYIQLFHVAIERDRAAETVPQMDAFVAEHPEVSDYTHHMHLLGVAAAGDHVRAARMMNRFYTPEFNQAVPVVNWTMHMAMLAETCMLLGDRERAEPIRAVLDSYSGEYAVAGFPTVCGGPLDLSLARVEALTGRTEAAERHLRSAIAQCEALGMRIHAGHARVDLTLLTGDPEPARRALEAARRMGFPRVARRAQEALGGMAEVHVLGPLTAAVNGRELELPALKSARSLLGLLAVERRTHSRTELAQRFWPGVLDESARTSLRTAIAALRRALGEDADRIVAITRDDVALAEGVRTDLEDLDSAEPAEALGLLRGPLLSGLDDDWVVERRDELRERTGRLYRRVAERSDPEAAIATIRAWVALDPLNEEPVRELMQRLDTAAALAAYERFSDRLRAAVGAAPSASLRSLAASLRGASEKRP